MANKFITTLTKAGVDAAYATCSAGDNLYWPAGTLTLASGQSLDFSATRVNHIGYGQFNVSDYSYVDSTIITGGDASPFLLATLGTTSSTVTGLTFWHNGTNGNNNACLKVQGQNVKVTQCNFVGLNTKVLGIFLQGNSATSIFHPTGCSWHNRFYGARAADCEGDLTTPYNGCRIWANADVTAALGNSNAWFTEDCYVNKVWDVGQNMWDHAYGGHTVTRYNRIIDCSIYGHGYDSAPPFTSFERSTLSLEVYGNHISQVNLTMGDPPVWWNGGYGVAWNNTVDGTWGSSVQELRLDYPDVTGKTGADYPLQDQPGRGIDASLWDGHTLPAPAQTLTPIYAWNNTLNGSALILKVRSGKETWIQSGRDFYNSQMPDYIPYTYPHPLRAVRLPGNRKGCVTASR